MTSDRDWTAIDEVPPSGVPNVRLAVRELRRSVEPDVVLSSMARACVPAFSDGCLVQLSVGVEPLFEVSYPLSDDDVALDGDDAGPAAGLARRTEPVAPGGTRSSTICTSP